MRDLILTMSMTLDGLVSGPNGENQWIFGNDQEAVNAKVGVLSDASLIIMGSRSFQAMSGFWQTAVSPFAPPMNEIPKAVFSKQGQQVLQAADSAQALKDGQSRAADPASVRLHPSAESWSNAYVAGGNLADEINKLKAQDGKPIVALGGATFARSLLAENLVDQLALMVHPYLLGQGLPIFSELREPKGLKMIRSKTFPQGAMLLVYGLT